MSVWNSAALKYSSENPGRNFHEDLVYIHDQLGLAIMLGKAAAVAHIVSTLHFLIMKILNGFFIAEWL